MGAWALPLSLKQREGFERFTAQWPRDFVVAMCPGTGKTRFALRCAFEALQQERIENVLVVVPSTHLRVQWAQEADTCGIPLLPDFRGHLPTGFLGGIVTFAGVAAAGATLTRFARSRRLLVIFDEIHHTSEWTVWGNALETMFASARHRMSLSGTPFRRDGVALPWYTYDEQQRVLADVALPYPEARALGLVRPVVAYPIDGAVSWRAADGRDRSANLSDVLAVDDSSTRLRSVLDQPDFIDRLLQGAHGTLVGLRRHDPAAGGIAFAMSVAHARQIAARIRAVTGTQPVLVVSEDPEADARIAQFRASTEFWIVAVRKVGEGVDIPRLRVCAYLTNMRSEWAVTQFVGRIMRRRGDDVRPSYLHYPADPILAGIVDRLLQGGEPPNPPPPASGGEGLSEQYEPAIQAPRDPWLARSERTGEAREPDFAMRDALRKQHTEMVKAVCGSFGVKPIEVYRQLKREFHTPLELASVPQLRSRVRYLARWLANGPGRRSAVKERS